MNTNYNFLPKPSTKDGIFSKIPELVISNKLIEQKRFTKFLGVLLDECLVITKSKNIQFNV